jgi:hypothetical protein
MMVEGADAEGHRSAFEGRREAILGKNLEPVELFDHSRRLGKPSGLFIVRFAIMEAGCNPFFVYGI